MCRTSLTLSRPPLTLTALLTNAVNISPHKTICSLLTETNCAQKKKKEWGKKTIQLLQ
jgi:hypothetical protein